MGQVHLAHCGDQGSQDAMYSTGNTKTAPCNTMVNSDQYSVHSSSFTVVLCSCPVVVRHQQQRVGKMNFSLHEYCDMYLVLGALGNRAYAAARTYAKRYPSRQ
jgi:hypothetical protein